MNSRMEQLQAEVKKVEKCHPGSDPAKHLKVCVSVPHIIEHIEQQRPPAGRAFEHTKCPFFTCNCPSLNAYEFACPELMLETFLELTVALSSTLHLYFF